MRLRARAEPTSPSPIGSRPVACWSAGRSKPRPSSATSATSPRSARSSARSRNIALRTRTASLVCFRLRRPPAPAPSAARCAAGWERSTPGPKSPSVHAQRCSWSRRCTASSSSPRKRRKRTPPTTWQSRASPPTRRKRARAHAGLWPFSRARRQTGAVSGLGRRQRSKGAGLLDATREVGPGPPVSGARPERAHRRRHGPLLARALLHQHRSPARRADGRLHAERSSRKPRAGTALRRGERRRASTSQQSLSGLVDPRANRRLPGPRARPNAAPATRAVARAAC
jgi:hypothetical protein